MRVKLKEICNKTYNINWKNNVKNTFEYIDLSSVSREELQILESSKVTADNAPSRAKQIVHEDDIIFATTRPTLKRITIIPKEYHNQICSTGFTVLRIKNDLAVFKYIFYALQSIKFMQRMEDMQRGASYPAVSNKDIKSFEIPLPPLPKQKAIAQKLDLSAKLIDLRKESIKKLDDLAKSVFVEMFGDPVENEMGWEVDKLDNFGEWKGGGTPSRKEPKYFKGKIPWITTVSLTGLYINTKNAAEYITEKAIERSATKVIPINSVIIGTRVGVGKVSINTEELCTNQDIISVVNLKKFINNIYFSHSIRHINRLLKNEQRGATIQGITSKYLRSIKLPIPPITLQQKFAKTIEKIESQKSLYEQELVKLEEGFAGLLQESFS